MVTLSSIQELGKTREYRAHIGIRVPWNAENQSLQVHMTSCATRMAVFVFIVMRLVTVGSRLCI